MQILTIRKQRRLLIYLLNFWASWCGPCKTELPYFGQVATEYADKVNVFAIHSVQGVEDAPAYIQESYPTSHMMFLADNKSANIVNGAQVPCGRLSAEPILSPNAPSFAYSAPLPQMRLCTHRRLIVKRETFCCVGTGHCKSLREAGHTCSFTQS